MHVHCAIGANLQHFIPSAFQSTNSWKEGEVDLNNEPEAPEIPDAISEVPKNQRISNEESKGTPKEIKNEKRIFKFNPAGQEPFDVEEILTHSPIKLEERMSANVRPGEKRVILSLNAGHSASNLQGCSDWNCEFTHDSSRMNEADAVLISYEKPDFEPTPNQYVVYFSQQFLVVIV
uniref:Uncharacterized protein n=1 Tax=Caenorhabditis japonica TaxID=281687 RepID=A0A8R1IBM1_CAEJA